MSETLRKAAVGAALVLAAAAWSPAFAQTEPAPAEAPAAEAPAAEAPAPAAQPDGAPVVVDAPSAEAKPIGSGAGSRTIMTPPPGKGQVVFFRRSTLVGAAIGGKVREGETEIGNLTVGRWFLHVTDPGQHAYSVKSEATDTLNIEVEEGETYFVEETISMGIMVGRPNLSPSDMANFDDAYPKMKPAKPLKEK